MAKMTAELLRRDGNHAKVALVINKQQVTNTFDKFMNYLAGQIRVPGFRPGKAPRGMLLSRIGGEEGLRDEVRQSLLEEHCNQAMEDLDLIPISIKFADNEEKPVRGQEFRLELDIELYPDIAQADTADIIIDTEIEQLSDEAVEEYLYSLRSEHATLIPIEDRPIVADDVVMVALENDPSGSIMPFDLTGISSEMSQYFIGKSVDDIVVIDTLANGDATDDMGDDEDSMALEAGATDAQQEISASEEPAEDARNQEPEGNDALSDARADHDDVAEGTEQIAHVAQEGDGGEDLDPDPSKLRLIIKDIKEKELPEKDDDFAQAMGFDSYELFEKNVRANMQAELNSEGLNAQVDEFIDKLVEGSSVEVPAQFLERQKTFLIDQLKEDLDEDNITLNSFIANLKEQGKYEDWEQDIEQRALEVVTRDVILGEFMEKRGTELSDTEFDQSLGFLAYRERMTLKQFKRKRGEKWINNYRYILTRNKALREAVIEIVGEPQNPYANEIQAVEEARRAALEHEAEQAAAEAAEATNEGEEDTETTQHKES